MRCWRWIFLSQLHLLIFSVGGLASKACLSSLQLLRCRHHANHRFPTSPSRTARSYASHSQDDESFESFTQRYVGFFTSVEDLFELQRGLNNCFAYDLVPAPEVIEAALKAARRVNDYSTAVRVFEGIREKVENKRQYEQYVEALKDVREELGITLREELYPTSS
ncbi:COX5A-domain-containing protein [Jaminaea rosea]|uniref:Cytochrome c oxidase subunit 6, mitochondrial n=1 Tax=Jaminaea rosea TaxID=1569628 RepID=A0A316ULZ9_9BASI|nr:COX5A-domain-containing protein [Jaminaea rosea]PWN26287.1 COX5A-domain-containing protein [Jaminaea rosea]